MIDDAQKPTGRVGDHEGFTEWMGEIMGELDDRRGAGGAGRVDDAELAPVAGADGVSADGRPHKRLLRWILR